jgi:hypothetical protein
MTGYGWPDFVGNIGVALIVLAYLGLQLGRIDGRSLSYSLANAIGAVLILVSLWFNFNLSSFIIEIFWLAISLVGIVRIALARGQDSSG